MNIKTKVPKVSGAIKFSNCFQVRPSRDRQNTEILQDVSNEVSGARLSIYVSNRICVSHLFQTRHSMNNFEVLKIYHYSQLPKHANAVNQNDKCTAISTESPVTDASVVTTRCAYCSLVSPIHCFFPSVINFHSDTTSCPSISFQFFMDK